MCTFASSILRLPPLVSFAYQVACCCKKETNTSSKGPQDGTLKWHTYLMETETVQPNVFDSNCGSRRVLALIADKWTAIVVYALANGTMRFGQLPREAAGVS